MAKVIRYTEISCSICGRQYESSKDANACERGHLAALEKVMPHYAPNQRAVVTEIIDGFPRKIGGRIVRIKGKNFETELLIEYSNGERSWVRAITFNLRRFRVTGRFSVMVRT